MYKLLFSLVPLAVVSLGCGENFQASSGSGGSSDGGSGASATGAGGSGGVPAGMCAEGEVEVAPAPGGWTAVVVAEGPAAGLPSCPSLATDLYEGIAGEPGLDCTCACGAPMTSACSAQVSVVTGDAQCNNIDTTFGLNDQQCLSNAAAMLLTHAKWESNQPDDGACDATVTEDKSEIDFSGTGRMCRVSPVSRGDLKCIDVPTGFAAIACVWNAGDVACPASYPAKQLKFTQIDDSRSCDLGSCGCGSGNAKCSGTVSIHAAASCAGPATVLAEGVCTPVPSALVSAKYDATVSGECAASGDAVPSGEVSLHAPVTICCAL
jgi:hypothetical protein